MCDGGKWNEAAEKSLNEAGGSHRKSLDAALDVQQVPRPQRMVMPRNPPGLLAYHIYPLIEESPSFYIVEDSPTLPDCIPMKRIGKKCLALPKSEWTLVPRYEWIDVTNECTVGHNGFFVQPQDPTFRIRVWHRVELKD